MDNYIPVKEDVREAENPFPEMYRDCLTMRIKKNTKPSKIVDFVDKKFVDDSIRFVVFKSIDGATAACVNCVEFLKHPMRRNQRGVPFYQWTKLTSSVKTVLWRCLEEGPKDIEVQVQVPAIFILISKDPFPGDFSCLSMQFSRDEQVPFLAENQQACKKSRSKKNRTRNSGEGNKWRKPGAEERKKEANERNELLKQVEKTNIS